MNRSLGAHSFKLSADEGDPQTQLNYGICLAKGDGIAINKSIAAHYDRLSADQGNPLAQFNYGYCLAMGAGIAINKLPATQYVTLAADSDLILLAPRLRRKKEMNSIGRYVWKNGETPHLKNVCSPNSISLK
jgi:RNA polymerase-binding transcription factor DksA